MITTAQQYQTIAALGAAEALKALGLSSGELSERQAKATYGRWFTEAVRDGAIRPCRQGGGSRRYYDVTEILRYKAAHLERAALLERR